MATTLDNSQLPMPKLDVDRNAYSVKILVVGDSQVGKSSLVHILCHKRRLDSPSYTIGCKMEVKIHEYRVKTFNRQQYFIEFWDIGGSISYEKTRHLFYDNADGIILVHDLSNTKSHDNLKRWLTEVLEHRNSTSSNSYGNYKHKYSKSQDFNASFDAEMYTSNHQLPTIIVGTKVDEISTSNGNMTTSSLANEICAEVTTVNCREISQFTDKSPELQSFNNFFDKVISNRYYYVPPKRSGSNLDLEESSGSPWFRSRAFFAQNNSSFLKS